MTNEELERLARAANGDATLGDMLLAGSAVGTVAARDFYAAADPATILALLSERAELLAAVERMQGALSPFAACAEMFADVNSDDIFIDQEDGVTLGECRRARAALTTGEGK